MSLTKKMCALVLLTLLPVFAWAQGKVVTLDTRAAVMSTAVAKAKMEKLQKNPDFAAAKAKREGLEADMRALQASFQKDGMTWSEEKRAESEKKMQSMGAEMQFQTKKLNAEMQAVMQEVMQELGPKVDAVIKQLIEAENISLIVDAGAVIAVKPEANITAKVTELLNKAK